MYCQTFLMTQWKVVLKLIWELFFHALALYCLDLIKSQNKQMSHCQSDLSTIFWCISVWIILAQMFVTEPVSQCHVCIRSAHCRVHVWQTQWIVTSLHCLQCKSVATIGTNIPSHWCCLWQRMYFILITFIIRIVYFININGIYFFFILF